MTPVIPPQCTMPLHLAQGQSLVSVLQLRTMAAGCFVETRCREREPAEISLSSVCCPIERPRSGPSVNQGQSEIPGNTAEKRMSRCGGGSMRSSLLFPFFSALGFLFSLRGYANERTAH
jgi:hypothetical protein